MLALLPLVAFSPDRKKKKDQATAPQVLGGIDYHQPGSPAPDIRVVTPSGRVLTNDSLASKGNLLVMMFNPTCDHCADVTDTLRSHISWFQDTKMVMVAGDLMMPYLKDFIHDHNLNQYPTINIGVDSSGIINKIYNYNSLPQINVYNPERVLIKVMTGVPPIDSLRKYIN